VPELEASQVTVVDQQGHLLSAPQGSDEFSLRDEHFQLVHRLEDDYTQRIEALLTPLVGVGRVRAQVVAQIDTAVTEEAREQYRPDSQIVRSEQLSEQTSRDGAGPQGVPGSLSNQPPAGGVVAPPAPAPASAPPAVRSATASGAAGAAPPAAPAPAPPDNVSKQSTRNYEIDRTLAYTRQPAGRLKRLTVAVLVDNVRTLEKDGKTKERPLSSGELEHITQLVKDAVGFDESRGDSVNVVNSSFQADAAPADTALEQVPIWERPLFRDLAKLAAGLIVLLVLALAVLRPLVRALIGPTRPGAPAVAARPAEPALAAPGGPQQPAVPGIVMPDETAPQKFEEQVAHARQLVNQDAKRVAQVVHTWVAADE
jgi:flagellar M-ring protein FliF